MSHSMAVFWLQGVTIVWMSIECGVSLYAAASAHSPAMLAFGADSFVELISGFVVLLPFTGRGWIPQRHATRAAGGLLFALAIVVAMVAVLALASYARPEGSAAGIVVTVAALAIMPVLARLKRREAARSNNHALAADAVQSATCAYLALVTLLGVAANAAFHIAWLDSAAALIAVPLLLVEARRTWHGASCACC